MRIKNVQSGLWIYSAAVLSGTMNVCIFLSVNESWNKWHQDADSSGVSARRNKKNKMRVLVQTFISGTQMHKQLGIKRTAQLPDLLTSLQHLWETCSSAGNQFSQSPSSLLFLSLFCFFVTDIVPSCFNVGVTKPDQLMVLQDSVSAGLDLDSPGLQNWDSSRSDPDQEKLALTGLDVRTAWRYLSRQIIKKKN